MFRSTIAAMVALTGLLGLSSACSDGSSEGSDESDLTSCSGAYLDKNGKCHDKKGKFVKQSCCAPQPKTCGGFAGLSCAANEYCAYETYQACGAGDQLGTCKPRPQTCPLGCPAPEFQTCGCDGQ